MDEIERKFKVKTLPDLTGIISTKYERYILPKVGSLERRVQKKGKLFELEELEEKSPLTRHKIKKIITEEEFNKLKGQSIGLIIRESYQISTSPNISIKIYHDKFEGLIRAE